MRSEAPGVSASSVAAPSDPFPSRLFGSAIGQPITVGILYGCEVVPPQIGNAGLTTYLPVGLYPNEQLGAGTAPATANALTAWQTANQPATRGGEWVFSITLYSQIDSGLSRPLLVLNRLVYRLMATTGEDAERWVGRVAQS